MKITHFQGTASWYTNGGGAGPVLASLVDRDPADYSHPPLMYPIILNSSGPGGSIMVRLLPRRLW